MLHHHLIADAALVAGCHCVRVVGVESVVIVGAFWHKTSDGAGHRLIILLLSHSGRVYGGDRHIVAGELVETINGPMVFAELGIRSGSGIAEVARFCWV